MDSREDASTISLPTEMSFRRDMLLHSQPSKDFAVKSPWYLEDMQGRTRPVLARNLPRPVWDSRKDRSMV